MYSNLLGISPKYLEFFVNNHKERYKIVQGSRRSGKTWAILKWLYFLASCNKEKIIISTSSYPQLQNTIQDFQIVTNLTVNGSIIYGYNCELPNGSIFIFKSFDNSTKAQGTKCTRLFIDEALNVEESIVTTLTLSVEKDIYFAYNPTKSSFLDKYYNSTKSNYLKTTYKDNIHLPQHQIDEFEKIKQIAQQPNSTQLQRYAYQVYVLGEFSSMAGKVFKEYYRCNNTEYNNIKSKEFFGLDFGFVDNNDETSLVGVKLQNNILYCKEYIFSKELSKDYNLALKLKENNITPYDLIFCDYGGLGKVRINNLITSNNGEWVEDGINKGFNCVNAIKGSIIDGINKIQQFDKIVIVEDSYNLQRELESYELNAQGKPNGEDHLIDALRYATIGALYYV